MTTPHLKHTHKETHMTTTPTITALTATEATSLFRDRPDVVKRAGNLATKLAASARRLTPSAVVSLARSLHPDLTLAEVFQTMGDRQDWKQVSAS